MKGLKMLRTYKAKLKGNYLEWIGSVPKCDEAHPLNVSVTILEKESNSEKTKRGKEMASILNKLSETYPFSVVNDPVQWQREVREDRNQPYRED